MSWCGVCGNSGRAVASNGKGESETNTKLPYQDRKSRIPRSHTVLQSVDHITQARKPLAAPATLLRTPQTTVHSQSQAAEPT
jgi:hypothetical protein